LVAKLRYYLLHIDLCIILDSSLASTKTLKLCFLSLDQKFDFIVIDIKSD